MTQTQTFKYLAGQTYIVKDLPNGKLPHISECELGAIFDRGARKSIVSFEVISNQKVWLPYVENISGWIPGQVWQPPSVVKPDAPVAVNWADLTTWSADNVATPPFIFDELVTTNLANLGITLTTSLVDARSSSPVRLRDKKPIINNGYKVYWPSQSSFVYRFNFSQPIVINQANFNVDWVGANRPIELTITLIKDSSTTEIPTWENLDDPAAIFSTNFSKGSDLEKKAYRLKSKGICKGFWLKISYRESDADSYAEVSISDLSIQLNEVGNFFEVYWDAQDECYKGLPLAGGEDVKLTTQNKSGWILFPNIVLGMNSAPTNTDDRTKGFRSNVSMWITVTSKVYICIVDTPGEALWGAANAQELVYGEALPSLSRITTEFQNERGLFSLQENNFATLKSNENRFSAQVLNPQSANNNNYIQLLNDGNLDLSINKLRLSKYFNNDFTDTVLIDFPIEKTTEGNALVAIEVSNVGKSQVVRLGWAAQADLISYQVATSLLGSSAAVSGDLNSRPEITALAERETSSQFYFVQRSPDTNDWAIARVAKDATGFLSYAWELHADLIFVWDKDESRLYSLINEGSTYPRYLIYPTKGVQMRSANAPSISQIEPAWGTWIQETETELRKFQWSKIGLDYYPVEIPWTQTMEGGNLVDQFVLNKPKPPVITAYTTPVNHPSNANYWITNGAIIGEAFGYFMSFNDYQAQFRINGVWEDTFETISFVGNVAKPGLDGARVWWPDQDHTTENPAYQVPQN